MSNRSDRVRKIGVPPIQKIAVKGYKSIRSEQAIEIRPLTLLAGANSSGKSSIMQSVLLLKQTLESTYDPGPLLLDGPNAKFSKASQLFFKGKGSSEKQFQITLDLDDISYTMHFSKGERSGLHLTRMDWNTKELSFKLTPQTTPDEILQILSSINLQGLIKLPAAFITQALTASHPSVARNRCFFEIRGLGLPAIMRNNDVIEAIRSIIHVPGLRGNPTRNYPVSAVGVTFPGTFENYTASILAKWQDEKSPRQKPLDIIGQYLKELGLTWKIRAHKVDDTKVELQVGRTLKSTQGGAGDMVNVADVGFGVSQTLPVLVALVAARPGQVVYLEQPEIHLHPRAQVAMAKILADAASRGVRVIAETHSSLLLTGVQTLVASGELSPDLVKLHWFTRDDGGETQITSANLDETGAFGDWPEDFDEVVLQAEGNYMDSVDVRIEQEKLF